MEGNAVTRARNEADRVPAFDLVDIDRRIALQDGEMDRLAGRLGESLNMRAGHANDVELGRNRRAQLE